MHHNKPLIDKQIILDLLYRDEDYFDEFVVASIDSFTEFKTNFQQSMQLRDLESLRKAGHKIKPISQMMKLNEILVMYDSSKKTLTTEGSDKLIDERIKKMNEYFNQLLKELRELKNN